MIPIELRGFISLNPTTCIYHIEGRSQREVSRGCLGGGLWGDFRGKAQVEVSGGSLKQKSQDMVLG